LKVLLPFVSLLMEVPNLDLETNWDLLNIFLCSIYLDMGLTVAILFFFISLLLEYKETLKNLQHVKSKMRVQRLAMPAWEYLKKHPDKEILLRQKGSTLFDLYSKGLIIWAKKI